MNEWTWGIIVALCNINLWVFGMYFVQVWESETGRIPPRKKWNPERPADSFPYLEDYHTGSWGDLIGLSLINFAVAGTLFSQGFSQWMIFCVGFGVVATIVFDQVVRKAGRRRSDWKCVDNRLTWAGKAHDVYFFGQMTSAVIALVLALVTRQMTGPMITIGLVGGALYIIPSIIDHRRGIADVRCALIEQGLLKSTQSCLNLWV